MKVILLKKRKSLGDVGDVVTVKNGYARNWLLPQGEALRATKENLVSFEARKHEILARQDAAKAEAVVQAEALEGIWVSLLVQTGEDGRLFGSVGARDVAKALADQVEKTVPKSAVVLSKPIKYLGVYDVTLEFFSDVTADLHVVVARSQDEAVALKEQALAEATKPEQTEEEVIAAAQAAAEADAPSVSTADEDELYDQE